MSKEDEFLKKVEEKRDRKINLLLLLAIKMIGVLTENLNLPDKNLFYSRLKGRL